MAKNNKPKETVGERFKNSRFAKFLERKIDWKAEQKITHIGKVLMFVLILVIELISFIELFSQRKLPIEEATFYQRLGVLIGASVTLAVCDGVRSFAVKSSIWKIVLFSVEIVASVAMIAVTGSNYLVFLYLILLTGFYISAERTLDSLIVFGVCIPAYLISYWMAMSLWHGGVGISYGVVISDSVWALILLGVHFILVNFLLGFYRQYLKLDKALTELADSRAELEKAYNSLAEASVLEERQRIAKDIHDTAGHSITTVIMQTEAARLVIDQDPEDAKRKLVAANLQARHALEELRESVHLLSGETVKGAIKMELQKIIEESTDGTGITIRYDLADVTVSAAKERFLCNTLKECISNGIRHGQATAFWVELKTEYGWVKLLVSDNGSGISESLKKGFGLSSMEQSAERLGGYLEIASEPDEGFEVTACLPIED